MRKNKFSSALGAIFIILFCSTQAAEPPHKLSVEQIKNLSDQTEKEALSLEDELRILANKKTEEWGDAMAATGLATLLKQYRTNGIIQKDKIDDVDTFIIENQQIAKNAQEDLQATMLTIATKLKEVKGKRKKMAQYRNLMFDECREKIRILEEENKKLKETSGAK